MGWGDAWNATKDGLSSAGEAVSDAGNAVQDGIGRATESVVRGGHDVLAGMVGGDRMAEKEAQARADQAKAEAQQKRADLAQQNQSLEAGIANFDPPSIKGKENWEAKSHKEIYDTNQTTIRPGEVSAAQEAWRKLGHELRTVGNDLDRDLQKKISEGWRGEAGQKAAESSKPLGQWMRDSGDAFELTGNRAEEANTSAEQAKAMVPQPDESNGAETFGRTVRQIGAPASAPVDNVMAMHQRQEGERQAQQTMQRVMSPTYERVDGGMPAYKDVQHKPTDPPDKPPEPNKPTPPPPVDPGSLGGGGGGAAGGGAGSASGSASAPSAPDIPAGSGSAWAPPGSGGPGAPGSGVPGSGMPGRGAPGGEAGGVMPMPGGAMGAGAAGGAAGGASGAGRGAMGGASGASKGAMGGGGRAGVGAGGAAGAGAGAGAGAAGAARGAGAGARGMPMGGAGMGAGAGQGDGDEEHDRPSWLEEHDDVWLNDMPRVAPPVLGE